MPSYKSKLFQRKVKNSVSKTKGFLCKKVKSIPCFGGKFPKWTPFLGENCQKIQNRHPVWEKDSEKYTLIRNMSLCPLYMELPPRGLTTIPLADATRLDDDQGAKIETEWGRRENEPVSPYLSFHSIFHSRLLKNLLTFQT